MIRGADNRHIRSKSPQFELKIQKMLQKFNQCVVQLIVNAVLNNNVGSASGAFGDTISTGVASHVPTVKEDDIRFIHTDNTGSKLLLKH